MHADLQLYKVFDVFLPFFLRAIIITIFAFFELEGSNEAKVTFVRRKPPLETLENITLLDGVELKTQNMSAFIDEQTVFNCRCYGHASKGRWRSIFLTNINFENYSVGSEIKLPHMHCYLSSLIEDTPNHPKQCQSIRSPATRELSN